VRKVHSVSIPADVAPSGAEACRFGGTEMNGDREPFDLVEVAGGEEE
jgi:hypothetical protein